MILSSQKNVVEQSIHNSAVVISQHSDYFFKTFLGHGNSVAFKQQIFFLATFEEPRKTVGKKCLGWYPKKFCLVLLTLLHWWHHLGCGGRGREEGGTDLLRLQRCLKWEIEKRSQKASILE